MTVSRHLMDSPAAAANRLFGGASLGLLLVTGLALQRGMLHFNEVSVGWSIPICAILCFLIGRGGLISNYFPDENYCDAIYRAKQTPGPSDYDVSLSPYPTINKKKKGKH